jgi:hypothetical protein
MLMKFIVRDICMTKLTLLLREVAWSCLVPGTGYIRGVLSYIFVGPSRQVSGFLATTTSFHIRSKLFGARGSVVVKALCYKAEGR